MLFVKQMIHLPNLLQFLKSHLNCSSTRAYFPNYGVKELHLFFDYKSQYSFLRILLTFTQQLA